MKQQFLWTVGVLAVVLLSGSVWAGSREVAVEVPFQFKAAEKSMSAGTYTIEQRGLSLRIRNGNGDEGTDLEVISVHPLEVDFPLDSYGDDWDDDYDEDE